MEDGNLQELLHLIAWKAEKQTFHALLSTMKRVPPRRNSFLSSLPQIRNFRNVEI